MKKEPLEKATTYNPFEGDFGDVWDRKLRDKIVKFRKTGECHCCGEQITPGTPGRSLTMLWQSDGIMTYRFCTACTQAQADSWQDEGRSLTVRYKIRFDAERRA